MDRREWERRNAEIALCETSRQLESEEMEVYQAHQWTDQTQRQKSWLFRNIAKEITKKPKNYE